MFVTIVLNNIYFFHQSDEEKDEKENKVQPSTEVNKRLSYSFCLNHVCLNVHLGYNTIIHNGSVIIYLYMFLFWILKASHPLDKWTFVFRKPVRRNLQKSKRCVGDDHPKAQKKWRRTNLKNPRSWRRLRAAEEDVQEQQPKKTLLVRDSQFMSGLEKSNNLKISQS